ncbi:MAG: tail fiber domain-containing protein [Bacteroidota bacterium]
MSIQTLLVAIALLFSATAVNAQLPGKPGGNTLNFFDTNPFGGQIAQEQVAGTFGTFGPGEQWIGIGQPTIGPGGPLLPVYGMRIQWGGNLGTFSLEDNGQLEIQWGGLGSTSELDFNFVNNPFGGSAGELNVMRMTAAGRVGINTANPQGRLDVQVGTSDAEVNGGNIRNRRSSGTIYGLQSSASNGSNTRKFGAFTAGTGLGVGYGTYGLGKIEEGEAYGLFGEGVVCSGVAYGVYGRVDLCGSGATGFAGFFDGDVFVTGTLTHLSDRRLKKNIENETEAIDRIMQLRPTTYEFNTEKFDFMNLDRGLNHGFIAQELEEVFPEMVSKVVHPIDPSVGELNEEEIANLKEPGATNFELKSVNYTMLIPVLTKAIQEQQTQLETEKARNDELQSELENIKAQLALLNTSMGKGATGLNDLESNVLFQNVPNPFDQDTEIRYTTVRTASDVVLNVYNLQGQEIARFNNLKPGEGSVNITGASLDAGMYLYTLIVDGQAAGTKRMILTKN